MNKKDTKKRCFYRPSVALKDALSAINTGMSISTASKTFKIPHSMLDAVLDSMLEERKKKLYAERKFESLIMLSNEEEKSLVNWIFYLSQRGFPITKNQLLDSVQMLIRYLKNKTTLINERERRFWYRDFLQRHAKLIERMTKNLRFRQAVVTEIAIRGWFNKTTTYLKSKELLNITPERIFSCDEATFLLNSKESVLSANGRKNIYKIVGCDRRESNTVFFTGNAAGMLAPYLISFSYKRIRRSKLLRYNLNRDRSDIGWMDSSDFYEYITNIFYPWLLKKHIPLPVILYVDGCLSHMTKPLSDFCRSHKIELIALYPNSTHILQPVEVSVFKSVKMAWKNIVDKYQIEHLKEDDFGSLIKEAVDSTNISKCLRNGFRVCGLYPFNANVIDYNKIIQNQNRQEVFEETQKILFDEETTQEMLFDEDTQEMSFEETEMFEKTEEMSFEETEEMSFKGTQESSFDEDTQEMSFEKTQQMSFKGTQERSFDEDAQEMSFEKTQQMSFKGTQEMSFKETQKMSFKGTQERSFKETQERSFEETQNDKSRNVLDFMRENLDKDIINEFERNSNVDKWQGRIEYTKLFEFWNTCKKRQFITNSQIKNINSTTENLFGTRLHVQNGAHIIKDITNVKNLLSCISEYFQKLINIKIISLVDGSNSSFKALSVETSKEDWPAELLELRDKFTFDAKQEIEKLKKMHGAKLTQLQEQFQTLLSRKIDKEDNWPTKLLEEREKVISNAEQKIQELKKEHATELAHLKDEHSCIVAQMLEQHQKEIANLKTNTSDKQEISCVKASENITKESDNNTDLIISIPISSISSTASSSIPCDVPLDLVDLHTRSLLQQKYPSKRKASDDCSEEITTRKNAAINHEVLQMQQWIQENSLSKSVNESIPNNTAAKEMFNFQNKHTLMELLDALPDLLNAEIVDAEYVRQH